MTFKSIFAVSALTLSALTWHSFSYSAQDISTKAQWDTAMNTKQPTIVKFSAAWCGPCKQMAPLFDKLSTNSAWSHIQFLKVDIDTQAGKQISPTFQIQSVPTTLFFKDGQLVERISGGLREIDLTTKMKHHFSK